MRLTNYRFKFPSMSRVKEHFANQYKELITNFLKQPMLGVVYLKFLARSENK